MSGAAQSAAVPHPLPATLPTPLPDAAPAWTPEARATFLRALARCGNVRAAALYVSMSREGAYRLRRRDPDFAAAWDAALLIAREMAEDVLQDRAINGVEEQVFYHGEEVATRRRYDSRLLLALLGRLDRRAQDRVARRGAACFDALTDAIAADRVGAVRDMLAEPTDEEIDAELAEHEFHLRVSEERERRRGRSPGSNAELMKRKAALEAMIAAELDLLDEHGTAAEDFEEDDFEAEAFDEEPFDEEVYAGDDPGEAAENAPGFGAEGFYENTV